MNKNLFLKIIRLIFEVLNHTLNREYLESFFQS